MSKTKKVRWIGPTRYLPRQGITAHQGELVELPEDVIDQYPDDIIGPATKTKVKPFTPDPEPEPAAPAADEE